MGKRNNKFKFNRNRFEEICSRTLRAFNEREGKFENREEFLPQWNTPKISELELPEYLLIMGMLERRSNSKSNITKGKETWENPRTRWIFNPKEVIKKDPEEIWNVCKKDLGYVLNNFPKSHQENMKKLLKDYNGDSRKIIEGKTVKVSKKALMEFKGVGKGIANLIMTYFLDRKIASPTDPENMCVKIDVHKSRIPLNTRVIETSEWRIRRDSLTAFLEEKYHQFIIKNGVFTPDLDSALFINGSEICAQRNYQTCAQFCPSKDLCNSNYREDRDTTEFVLKETDVFGGVRKIDTRKYKNQLTLFD